MVARLGCYTTDRYLEEASIYVYPSYGFYILVNSNTYIRMIAYILCTQWKCMGFVSGRIREFVYMWSRNRRKQTCKITIEE